MPKINLDGMAPEAGETTPPLPVDPRVELLLQALESPRGIALTFDSASAASSARFRFYALRRRQQRRGNFVFDQLLFTLVGATLKIVPPPTHSVEEL